VPRAIWTGAITFGLVNAPVRMYSAVSEKDLHFNLLHEPDDSRIGYEKVCKKEGKPVPDDEIVKAYELKKGEFVVLDDEDFEAVEAGLGGHMIEITDFVPYDDIDPIYFERTYHLGPEKGAEKVYALLRDAMEASGLAAIARYVMRNRQHLAALRVREGTITLERLFYADEVRPIDDIAPGKIKVDPKELKMASSLIEQFTSDWEPESYRDEYREKLLARIRAKNKGKAVTPPATPEQEEPADLLAALRASVDAAKQGRSRTAKRKTTSTRRTPARKPAKRASSRR
jgi:DNA end-binding protein Ku